MIELEKIYLNSSETGLLYKALSNGGKIVTGKFVVVVDPPEQGKFYRGLSIGVIGEPVPNRVFFNNMNTSYVKKPKPVKPTIPTRTIETKTKNKEKELW